MASAGDYEREPLILKDQTGDDDDVAGGGDVSTGFNPGEPEAQSTPDWRRRTRLNSHTPSGDVPSVYKPVSETPSVFEPPSPLGLSTTFYAQNELDKEFKFANKSKIKFMMENDRLKVGIIAAGKIKPYYFLTTKVPGKEEYQINPRLPKEVLNAFGKSRRDTIEEKMQKLTEEIADYKKRADDANENLTERNKAREYASWKLNERTDLKKELDRLKKGNYQPSENIAMETFTKYDEDRQQREEEIQSEREKNNAILNAENSTPEEKERAREANRELDQEANEIENEREGEISQLRLRDRIREKVKAIFKKYGFTVTAVLLAVGTTIGVILSSLSNSLKSVANGVGKRFQSSWQKTG